MFSNFTGKKYKKRTIDRNISVTGNGQGQLKTDTLNDSLFRTMHLDHFIWLIAEITAMVYPAIRSEPFFSFDVDVVSLASSRKLFQMETIPGIIL